MLVRHVEGHRVARESKDARTSHQRHVVVVHDIVVALFEQAFDPRAVHHRPPELLGQQGGEDSQAAAQSDDLNALIVRDSDRLRTTVQGVVGVHIVDHGDVVATSNQGA